MEKREALYAIQRALHFGVLAKSLHARERMIERKFSDQDLVRGLFGGAMIEGPTKLKGMNGFACVMRIRLDDERWLKIPIIVDIDANRIFIKTVVFEGRKPKKAKKRGTR